MRASESPALQTVRLGYSIQTELLLKDISLVNWLILSGEKQDKNKAREPDLSKPGAKVAILAYST